VPADSSRTVIRYTGDVDLLGGESPRGPERLGGEGGSPTLGHWQAVRAADGDDLLGDLPVDAEPREGLPRGRLQSPVLLLEARGLHPQEADQRHGGAALDEVAPGLRHPGDAAHQAGDLLHQPDVAAVRLLHAPATLPSSSLSDTVNGASHSNSN
jgi:hypothetical protein